MTTRKEIAKDLKSRMDKITEELKAMSAEELPQQFLKATNFLIDGNGWLKEAQIIYPVHIQIKAILSDKGLEVRGWSVTPDGEDVRLVEKVDNGYMVDAFEDLEELYIENMKQMFSRR